MIPVPKACYFDIDGTLVGKSGEIDPSVLSAVHKLHEKGILIGIATGRPWFAAKEIAEKLETNAPCMTYSGALLIDRERDGILRSHFLSAEDTHAVLQLAQKHNWHIELYDKNTYYVHQQNRFTSIHSEYLGGLPKEENLESLAQNSQILKTVVMFEGDLPADVPSLIQEHTSHTEIAIAYGAAHPEIHFVNVTNSSAKRLNALDEICKQISCTPKDILAFGDGEADIPFLASVGWGVAMGNANEEVKQKASYVTGSVEEHGVLQFLEELNLT